MPDLEQRDETPHVVETTREIPQQQRQELSPEVQRLLEMSAAKGPGRAPGCDDCG